MTTKYYTNTVSATHGVALVAGLLDVRENHRKTYKVMRGDGQPEQRDNVDSQLTLTLTFSNAQAAADFAAAAQNNLIVRNAVFGGGADDNVTYKNVEADSSAKSIPTRQDTNIGNVSVEATAVFGTGDTYATMVTTAAAA